MKREEYGFAACEGQRWGGYDQADDILSNRNKDVTVPVYYYTAKKI